MGNAALRRLGVGLGCGFGKKACELVAVNWQSKGQHVGRAFEDAICIQAAQVERVERFAAQDVSKFPDLAARIGRRG